MDDNNNLTPEEIEQLEREEAQKNTEPSFGDRISNAKNTYDNVNKIKKIIEERKLKNASDVSRASQSASTATETGATAGSTASTATGTSAAGTGASAATGAGTTAAGAGTTAAAGAGASAAAGAGTTAAAGAGASAAAGAGATAAAGAGATAVAATPVGWIILIVIGVVILLLGLVLFLSLLYYNVIEPVSSKYSVGEEDVINKYDANFVGDEDCEDYTEAGGICNVTTVEVDKLDDLLGGDASLSLWQHINHLWYNLTGNLLWDVSEDLAAIILKEEVDDRLAIMGKEDDKNALPMGTLVSTLDYTYSSQYTKLDYKDYKDIFEFEGSYIELTDENRVNPTNPSSTLASLLNEDILSTKKPDDINDLLDNLVFHEFYPTYTWGEVSRKCDKDEDGNETNCTIYMGCNVIGNDKYEFDLYKYYLYLRYGAYVSGYALDSSNKYKTVGTGDTTELWGKTGVKNYKEDSNHTIAFGYEYFKNLNSAYISSSTECELKQKAEEAVAQLNASASDGYKYELDNGSVDDATNFFKERDVTDGYSVINTYHEIFDNFSKYDEKAIPFTSGSGVPKVKVDNTTPNGDGTFAVNILNGEEYEYEHGWVYNRFPFYREEFQLEENKEYEYDEVITPVDIERFIYNIDNQKDVFDNMLGYDTSVYASNTWSSSFNSDGTESFPISTGDYTITSCVGERTIDGQLSNHGGIDIAVSRGTPLYTWKSGVVVRTNNSCGEGYYGDSCGGGYGNYVVVDHGEIDGEKFYTVYAHMTNTTVSVGDSVSAGQQIGVSGNSGSSTGPHLHFEIRTGGTEWTNATKQDPYPTLAEIIGGEDLPEVCQEGTVLNAQQTTMNGTQTANENKKELCELLVSKFSEDGAIALMANASHESGYSTTANGDSGTSYGLFQWHDTRKQSLMSNYPDSYTTVQSQYDYLLSELNSYSSLYSSLANGTKSSKELTYDFCYEFERPANKETTCKSRTTSSNYADAEAYVKNGCQ